METLPHPTRTLRTVFLDISRSLYDKGNLADGRTHARKAQQIAAILGDQVGQAFAFGQEALCCIGLGFFHDAAQLCQQVRDLTCMWGLQGSNADIVHNQILEAGIHFLKTEYPEACLIYEQIVRSTPPGYWKALALLNIAIIDIARGAPAASVHINLRLDPATPSFTILAWIRDGVDAALMLREGDTAAARAILERLANLDYGMYDCQTTLSWVAVYLGSALRTKDKLSTMKALNCLGQIAAAKGESSTAMSLFQVALDGFTVMDVHQWKADCMMRMSKIHLACSEVLRAKELFEAALPLFDRCRNPRIVGERWNTYVAQKFNL
ncbi:hypothetical protein GGX14DRAFT_579082 [Mycena pura]|uniref:Uncharacterized protein n=1 Tax=Mycena pura TaxID=153505 RepID=A0AAD6UNX3_9AGAR|nr:hypothetical protein GGX14DRAFT_579082 [Mycena pura]